MTARLVAEPRTLSVVRPDMQWPAGLQQVFNQALDRDPAQRTASAGAFAKAFEAALQAPARPAPAVAAAPAATAGAAPSAAPASAPASAHGHAGAARSSPRWTGEIRRSSASRAPNRRSPRLRHHGHRSPARRCPGNAAAGTARGRRRRRAVDSHAAHSPPSLSLVLVLPRDGGTEAEAPRVSDIDRLVNSATNTAGKLIEGAQGPPRPRHPRPPMRRATRVPIRRHPAAHPVPPAPAPQPPPTRPLAPGCPSESPASPEPVRRTPSPGLRAPSPRSTASRRLSILHRPMKVMRAPPCLCAIAHRATAHRPTAPGLTSASPKPIC